MRTRCICLIAFLSLSAGAGAARAEEGFIATASGLAYRDLRAGSGAVARPGDVAVVHLVGWLDAGGREGKEIYNSRRQGQPLSFVIGTDKVMQGWSEGVTGMRAGGTRMVRVPPELGYGDKAVEDLVPPHARLLFLFELLAVK